MLIIEHCVAIAAARQLSPYVGLMRFPAPVAGSITAVRLASRGSVNTNGDAIFDLKVNGVSIFASDAVRPKILSGAASGSVTPTVTNAVALFDEITIDLLSVPSGGIGGSVWMMVEISWDNAVGGSQTVGSGLYSSDIAPSTLNAKNDEFLGTALDAKWTRWQGSDSTLAILDGLLSLSMTSQASDKANGIFQAVPTGDWTIITKFITRPAKANFNSFGLALFQAATGSPNTSDFVSFQYLGQSANRTLTVDKWSDHNTYGSQIGSGVTLADADIVLYQKITKVGTTYTFYYSYNGYVWLQAVQTTSTTIGYTPAEFGIFINNAGSGQTLLGLFDFFRVYTTDPNYIGGSGGGGVVDWLADYISGLKIVWLASDGLRVEAGEAYVPSLGNVLRLPSALDKTALAPTANTWYHVYLYQTSGGVADIEISTTAPATAAYAGVARTKNGDASRRYLGSVRCADAGFISFLHTLPQNWFLYRTQPYMHGLRVLGGGGANTETNVDCSAVIPVTGRSGYFRFICIGASLSTGIPGDDDFTGGGSSFGLLNMNPPSETFLLHPLTSAQIFSYWSLTGTGTGTHIADCYGFQFER